MRSDGGDEEMAGPHQHHQQDQVHGLSGRQQVGVGPKSLQSGVSNTDDLSLSKVKAWKSDNLILWFVL